MKNKFLSKLFVLALVITSSIVMFACDNDIQKEVNIESIEILLDTVPSTIKVGEFDSAGIKAKVTYEDDTFKEINVTTSLIPEEYRSLITTPGIYTIKIAFRNQTAELEVTIVKADNMYEVAFYNYYEQLISKQYVWSGEDATLPSSFASRVEGYTLTGWDKSHENITADTKIYGVYVNVENVINDEYMQNALLNAEKYYIENNHYTVVDYRDAIFTINYHYDTEDKVGTAQSVMQTSYNTTKYNITENFIEMLELDAVEGNEYDKKTFEQIKQENPSITDEELAIGIANGGMSTYTCSQLLDLSTIDYNYELCENRVIYIAEFSVQKEEFVQIYTYKYDDEKLLSMNISGKENLSETIEEEIEFSIEYITYDFVDNFLGFGDVDGNDRINTYDITLVRQHIEKVSQLSEEQKFIADVNIDGVIDYVDILLMRQYFAKLVDVLPYETNIVLGDVNCDGVVDVSDPVTIEQYLNAIISGASIGIDGIVNGDVNQDGVFGCADLMIIRHYLAHNIDSLPYKTNILTGDVNCDGEINEDDLTLLNTIINDEDSINVTIDNLLNADITQNGEVDEEDYDALTELLTQQSA